jgi:hypothetical protein
MAKKQKRLEQVATAPGGAKAPVRYQDPFQQKVNARLENAEKTFAGEGPYFTPWLPSPLSQSFS